MAVHVKRVYIRSQSADPAPPLGTILGNLGVNTVNFCNAFNSFTVGLPNYYVLPVTITIAENRSVTFSVEEPCTTSILGLLRFERAFKIRISDRWVEKTVACVHFHEVLMLAKFKFGACNAASVSRIMSVVRSLGLIAVMDKGAQSSFTVNPKFYLRKEKLISI